MSENRFERPVVSIATQVLSELADSELTTWLLDLGQGIEATVGIGGSSQDRTNNLLRFYDFNPYFQTQLGQGLDFAIVEKAARLVEYRRPSGSNFWDNPTDAGDPSPEDAVTHAMQEFLRRLNGAGYTVSNGTLLPIMPQELDLVEGRSEVLSLLDKLDFPVAKGHLEQALENHGLGNWSAANGQIRHLLEDTLDCICLKLDQNSGSLSHNNKRDRLVELGFLSKDLNEYGTLTKGQLDGKNFINGLYKRLCPEGGHKGLSHADDSTFRLHITLITVRLLLKRFATWSNGSSG